MAIDAIILKAIQEDESITSKLALFDGEPAVFYQTAPPDTDSGWMGVQFPRMDFNIDWTYNPERRADGSCVFNIWCLNNGQTYPDDIGNALIECLRDVFFTDTDGEVYAMEWQRTDAFEAGGQDNEPLTVGVTLSFDMLAFPPQITIEPDPVAGICDYIKSRTPEALVIGIDQMEQIVKPSAEHPVIYVRLSGDSSAMRNSWAVAWMDVTLQVHVFAPGATARQMIGRILCNAIALDGECKLRDCSPMLFKRVAITLSANPLRQGQIAVTGRYGVPWIHPETPKLINPNMKGEFGNGK